MSNTGALLAEQKDRYDSIVEEEERSIWLMGTQAPLSRREAVRMWKLPAGAIDNRAAFRRRQDSTLPA
jgi:hypothetical protein